MNQLRGHKYRIHRNIVTEEERSVLVDWAKDLYITNQLEKNSAGPYRFFRKSDDLKFVHPLFNELRTRIANTLDVEDIVEPVFGSFVSVIENRGFVHEHVDQAPPGYRHLRCNVLIQKPEVGGIPIIHNETLDGINQGDMWYFYPHLWRHSCNSVNGVTKRINLSFGFLVK